MTTSATLASVNMPSSDQEDWNALGSPDAFFGDRACGSVEVDGHKIGLFRVDGQFFAIDDICTHGNARLSDGEVDGFEVECPLHAGVFDVRNGKALSAPLTRDVRSHAMKVVDGQLFICLRR